LLFSGLGVTHGFEATVGSLLCSLLFSITLRVAVFNTEVPTHVEVDLVLGQLLAEPLSSRPLLLHLHAFVQRGRVRLLGKASYEV